VLKAESPFIRRAARRAPSVRLLCLPHAGGGASTFGTWPDRLPPDIEVIAAQLPGREDRQFEPLISSVKALARTLARVVRPYLDVPLALFGYCAGGLLAFELARELDVGFGATLAHLFVASHAAPHLPARHMPLHTLSDEALKAELRRLGGTAPAVLQNDALLDFLLPGLRADFQVWESYQFEDGEPLSCPITAVGGSRDERATLQELQAWQRHTRDRLAVRLFESGHFVLSEVPGEVIDAVAEALRCPPLKRDAAPRLQSGGGARYGER
jgi:medium-chain acyl-[acyl-carrier-protein] hydrolase